MQANMNPTKETDVNCRAMTHTKRLALMAAILLFSQSTLQAQQPDSSARQQIVPFALEIKAPGVILASVPFNISVRAVDEKGRLQYDYNGALRLSGVGTSAKTDTLSIVEGEVEIRNLILPETGRTKISVASGGKIAFATVRVIPGLLSILPPVLAIVLAFMFRQVLLSLFLGIWLGAVFVFDYSPLTGFMRTLDRYFINALADKGHAAILIFSLTLGGMVGVISRGGGMQGIVESIRKFAKTPKGGQIATWLMGVFIFFDDYANTLLVGNTMRPFTDKLRISREKLSYIVDSTAAPVASVALISTWIGYQIGLIDQVLKMLGLQQDAYFEFIQSIPFTFYSLLAIVFVFLIGYTLRDFGPMRKAERRAGETGAVLRDGAEPLMDTSSMEVADPAATPLRWYNGLVPVLAVIAITIVGLYVSGVESLGDEARRAGLRDIIAAADSFSVLMWASFTGLFVAAVLVLAQRILSLNQTVHAIINGYRSMMLAAMILTLAWSIGAICEDLQTANYVIEQTRDYLSPHLVPALTFTIAAFIAFSTGSSWATMAIFIPIAIPIAYTLPGAQGVHVDIADNIVLATIGAVLAGSVFGDHCSPISDTTIMSSMASAADHVDHVRTQLPYAVVVAVVAILFGYLPAGYGVHPILSHLAAIGVLVGIVFLFGRKGEAGER